MNIATTDTQWMQQALNLSRYAEGKTAPNPMVGAVLVCDNRLIGQGFHALNGSAHAEVNCLESVLPEDRHLISRSTMYVTLEPCSHYGKTPPCAALLVRERVQKVVIACADTFSEVNGAGIALLRKEGIVVDVGLLETAARWVNRRFFTFHEKKRPHLLLKWATTADGKMGSGSDERLLISNDLSNRWVHQLRSQNQAIIVGAHTVLLDNPLLDTRNFAYVQPPLKIVLDRQGICNPNAALFNQGNKTLLFTENSHLPERFIHLTNVEVVVFPHTISTLLSELYQRNIQSVLVEGGYNVLESFIASGFWDEAIVIRGAHTYAGHGLVAPILSNATRKHTFHLQQDQIDHYINSGS